MIAEVEIKTVTSLDPRDTPEASDLILLIVNGLAKRANLEDVRKALAVVTDLEKGLMSASDKVALTNAIANIAKLFGPTSITLASAASIAIPANTLFVTITGTTNITEVTGLANNRHTWFYYPTGAGLTILGEPVKALDPPLSLIGTA